MQASPVPTLLAPKGSLEGYRNILTSFTEMHVAQIRTNILPRSCSQLILCVSAKGCGRSWGRKEEDDKDEEQGGKGNTSPEGTRLYRHSGPSRWTRSHYGTSSPGPACPLVLIENPELCSERDNALFANKPIAWFFPTTSTIRHSMGPPPIVQ